MTDKVNPTCIYVNTNLFTNTSTQLHLHIQMSDLPQTHHTHW